MALIFAMTSPKVQLARTEVRAVRHDDLPLLGIAAAVIALVSRWIELLSCADGCANGTPSGGSWAAIPALRGAFVPRLPSRGLATVPRRRLCRANLVFFISIVLLFLVNLQHSAELTQTSRTRPGRSPRSPRSRRYAWSGLSQRIDPTRDRPDAES